MDKIAEIWNRVERSLFAHLRECLPVMTHRHRRLVLVLEVVRVEDHVHPFWRQWRGRKRKDRKALATLTPERISFGTMKVNAVSSRILRVMPTHPKAFSITKVDTQGGHVSVPGFKRVQDKTGTYWALTVLVNGGASAGEVHETITIHHKAGADGVMIVQVDGNVTE